MKLFSFIFISLLGLNCFPQSEGILNKLLAPGPLILGHQKLEKTDCLECHTTGEGITDEKCLACHKPIQTFVTSKKGFHGLTQKACYECHTDHKGRDFNSLQVDEANFNHKALTGYALEGKHEKIKCAECHKAKHDQKSVIAGKTRYFGEQATSCRTCHKKDDIHGFKGEFAKTDCVKCHSLSSWKEPIQFAHDKDTQFKLEGKHRELKCSECHGDLKKGTIYQWPKLKTQACLSCHEDFHKSRLSSKFQNGQCIKCHTQSVWKIPDFNHGVSGFNLRGKHKELQCITCHKQTKPLKEPQDLKHFHFAGSKSTCISCHQKQDIHHFGNLKSKTIKDIQNCGSCHNETSWKSEVKFNHTKRTRFPIDGEHESLTCLDCHTRDSKTKKKYTNAIYKWGTLQTKTCEICHGNPHHGQFNAAMAKKKCNECHVTTGWADMKGGTGFSHAKTRFPLTGAHVKTKCVDCHGPPKKQVFKFKTPEFKFCIDCHSNIHHEQFSAQVKSTNCALCHTTDNFKRRLDFDHAGTRFPLDGAHSKTKCEDCHYRTKTQINIFPPNIAKKELKPEQKHGTIHLSQFNFKTPQLKFCSDCHHDIHKEQFSEKIQTQDCKQCHTTTNFKQRLEFNHGNTRYPLEGAHTKTKCEQCHIPSKTVIHLTPPNIAKAALVANGTERAILKASIYKMPHVQGGECGSCHTDIHKGQLSKNCQTCHNVNSWKKLNFDHNKHTEFPILGKHAEVACQQCHTPFKNLKVTYKGKEMKVIRFKGFGKMCMDCHKDVHNGGFGTKCQDCHNERDWKATKNFHVNFTLTGVHYSLTCNECHTSNRKLAGMSQACNLCHARDDVHSGTLPKCQECHRQQYWEITNFRHSLTLFPLRGAHRTLDCLECHRTGTYKGLTSTCVGCHLADANAATPSHAGFGNLNTCTACHLNQFVW